MKSRTTRSSRRNSLKRECGPSRRYRSGSAIYRTVVESTFMIRQSGLFFVVALAFVTATRAFAQSVRLRADASAGQVATPSPQQPVSGNTVGTVVDISGA